ncbi:hypothetical protein [Embleya sp. NPDC020630]|uniref:hypothetical protein n=1 Tax=Embleya sp. NPDC020630 TaxID=3363979 RepID=UPI0037907F37
MATDTLTGVPARPASGDPAFRTVAGVLTEELLDRYPAPGAVAGPGLLDGVVGVILALLAATTPNPPEWDWALLLG